MHLYCVCWLLCVTATAFAYALRVSSLFMPRISRVPFPTREEKKKRLGDGDYAPVEREPHSVFISFEEESYLPLQGHGVRRSPRA